MQLKVSGPICHNLSLSMLPFIPYTPSFVSTFILSSRLVRSISKSGNLCSMLYSNPQFVALLVFFGILFVIADLLLQTLVGQ